MQGMESHKLPQQKASCNGLHWSIGDVSLLLCEFNALHSGRPPAEVGAAAAQPEGLTRGWMWQGMERSYDVKSLHS